MSIRDRSLPELPTLDPGIRLLEAAEVRGGLHALVVDHALAHRAPVYWLDAAGHASTRPLARLAPTRRLLERVRVARAFTAFQHFAALEHTRERVGDETPLVVAPAFDARYRDSDLGEDDRTAMQAYALATLAAIARDHDVPVLVTRTRDDAFAAPIARAARETIRCTQTPYGPRFEAADFETLVYPDRGGFQTTLAYWRRIIAARRPLHAAARPDAPAAELEAARGVEAHGAD